MIGEDNISLNTTETKGGNSEMSDSFNDALMCMDEELKVGIDESLTAKLPLMNATIAVRHIMESELSDEGFIEALVSSAIEIENSISEGLALTPEVQQNKGVGIFN